MKNRRHAFNHSFHSHLLPVAARTQTDNPFLVTLRAQSATAANQTAQLRATAEEVHCKRTKRHKRHRDWLCDYTHTT